MKKLVLAAVLAASAALPTVALAQAAGDTGAPVAAPAAASATAMAPVAAAAAPVMLEDGQTWAKIMDGKLMTSTDNTNWTAVTTDGTWKSQDGKVTFTVANGVASQM